MASPTPTTNDFAHIRVLPLTPDKVTSLTISEEGDNYKARLYQPGKAPSKDDTSLLSKTEIGPFMDALLENLLSDPKFKLPKIEKPVIQIPLPSGTTLTLRGDELIDIFENAYKKKITPPPATPPAADLKREPLPSAPKPKAQPSPAPDKPTTPTFEPLKVIRKLFDLLDRTARNISSINSLQKNTPERTTEIERTKNEVAVDIYAFIKEAVEQDTYRLNQKLPNPHPELDSPWILSIRDPYAPLSFGGAITISIKSAIDALPHLDSEKLLLALLESPDFRSQASFDLHIFSNSIGKLKPRDPSAFTNRLKRLESGLSAIARSKMNPEVSKRIHDTIENIKKHY